MKANSCDCHDDYRGGDAGSWLGRYVIELFRRGDGELGTIRRTELNKGVYRYG
jgi:hypothetical protein